MLLEIAWNDLKSEQSSGLSFFTVGLDIIENINLCGLGLGIYVLSTIVLKMAPSNDSFCQFEFVHSINAKGLIQPINSLRQLQISCSTNFKLVKQ